MAVWYIVFQLDTGGRGRFLMGDLSPVHCIGSDCCWFVPGTVDPNDD